MTASTTTITATHGKKWITAIAGLAAGVCAGQAHALDVEVEVTNVGPTGGVFVTPLWVGFHDGGFDSYNAGQPVQEGLERIAEDGATGTLSADFLSGYTYIDAGTSARVLTAQTTGRVDGTIASPSGPPPIAPGETVSQAFAIDALGANRYFSYASMVLPSNDYFIANGNPTAHDLSSLEGAPVGTEITFFIGTTVNDAGTEVNDFAFSAANGLFPQLNIGTGQGGPNTGTDENGVVSAVAGADPFAGFLNQPAGFGADPDTDAIDFNDAALYPNGLARVTVRVVPEPASLAMLGVAGLGVLRRRRR
ncbi:MAG: spondin domain-containing protein [Phycisphaeraceae bacterium]